jgi:hypothetical protein
MPSSPVRVLADAPRRVSVRLAPGNTPAICRLFGMSGGRRPTRATFWVLEAPDSLAEQSEEMLEAPTKRPSMSP